MVCEPAKSILTVDQISGGRVSVPSDPGLGLTLSAQARDWTQATHDVGDVTGF